MRATTIHAAGDIRLEDLPVPAPERPTDAVVKVAAACICGSDLWPYRGANPIRPGQTIGHEMIGWVEEVGAEVRDFEPGDFVIAPFCHCDNTCPNCAFGMQSACVNSALTVSGQAEYAVVTQADGTLVKTADVPDRALWPALLTLSDVMPTGWHAAVSARVTPGCTAAVVGDGAVGLCGVLAASQLGAERVILMSRHEPRQKVAKTFGVTDIVEVRGEEGEEQVRELTAVGADAVLECVGTDQAMRTALAIARPGAMVGFVGVPHGVEIPAREMFSRNVGLQGGIAPVRRYLPDLLSRVQAGTLDPSPVFDLTLPLEQAAEGYRAMDERRAIKVLLEP